MNPSAFRLHDLLRERGRACAEKRDNGTETLNKFDASHEAWGYALALIPARFMMRDMGLRDLFSKPKTNSKHHHFFAHYALRQVAFAEPVRIFGVLASDLRIKFFDDLLRDLDTRTEERRTFSGSDIRFSGSSIGDRPCAILKMPAPTNPVEAYFIAIVGRLPAEQLSAQLSNAEAGPLIDYYTLERPVEVTPEDRSVFCAWTDDGSHINYGSGPEPTLEAFSPFLAQHVASSEISAKARSRPADPPLPA